MSPRSPGMEQIMSGQSAARGQSMHPPPALGTAADVMRPARLVTEADIVRAVADGKDVNVVRIQDLMTTHPTVISATTSIRDAARAMMAGHFWHLPVVGDAGLIGMVDIKDVCA